MTEVDLVPEDMDVQKLPYVPENTTASTDISAAAQQPCALLLLVATQLPSLSFEVLPNVR